METLGMITVLVIFGAIIYALYSRPKPIQDRTSEPGLSDHPVIWDNMSPEARKQADYRLSSIHLCNTFK
jgi:hypothetical protein